VGDIWTSCVHLKLVIENSETSDVILPPECRKSDFIDAALHAAKYSKSTTRTHILKDVSEMLGCDANDLTFLFHAEKDTRPGTIYPFDMPDSRLRESDIYLQAAE